jgi:hypothetical protein
MRWKYWGVLALIGSLAFLVLIIADWERHAAMDRLSKAKIPPQSALEADPDLKLVPERSPYMRNER